MITQKKMIIPIFNYKLTVVIFDKWEELGRFLPKEEMEQEGKAENKVVEYLGEY